MDLAIQIISNDKTVTNDTMVDLKEFNKQSLATKAKKENNPFLLCLQLKRLLI